MVVSSSLTPQAALLVLISGPIDSVVERCGFTELAKDHMLKQTWPSIGKNQPNCQNSRNSV